MDWTQLEKGLLLKHTLEGIVEGKTMRKTKTIKMLDNIKELKEMPEEQ